MKNMRQKAAPLALWIGALAVRKVLDFSTFIAPNFVIVTPLLGSFLSASSVCGTFAVLTVFNLFFHKLGITFGIPTLLATLSWSVSSNKKSSLSNAILDATLNVLLPLACIALFISHPVGNGAASYALYWFIPMVAWALRLTKMTSTSFIIALQSTFVAHAVGSVIWLFTVPMTAEQWLVLIPIVAIERITIAGTSTLLYEVGRFCVAWVSGKSTSPEAETIRI